jgi:hypothetical protein
MISRSKSFVFVFMRKYRPLIGTGLPFLFTNQSLVSQGKKIECAKKTDKNRWENRHKAQPPPQKPPTRVLQIMINPEP